jgi:hypothetical protein
MESDVTSRVINEIGVVTIVEEGESASYGIIETLALSSCICLLLDGMVNNKSFYFLNHASRVDDYEEDTPEELLIFLLTKLSDDVIDKLQIPSLSKNENKISNLTLLIRGGAKEENDLTRASFSLLNKKIDMDLVEELTDDPNVIHICKELLNSVIVIRSITYLA